MKSRKAVALTIRNKLNFTVEPSRRDQLLAHALQEQEQSQKIQPARKEPLARRMIMRSPITKLAVAAAVVLAALAGMYALTGSVDGTSITMAQVRQAMENVDWMQMSDKAAHKTVWVSFASKIQAAVDHDGKTLFADFNAGRMLIWSPGSPDIYESPVDKTPPFADGASGPFELVTRFFDRFTKERGWSITKELGSYQDRKAEIWRASCAAETPGTMKMCTAYLDVESKLPLGCVTGIKKADGSIETWENIEWSYPETGPADIYAIGVPRSAQIKPAPTGR